MTYNSAATIEACLDAALATRDPGDVVMVYDNASTDGTATIVAGLQRRFPGQLLLERSAVNLGFGRAVNAAVALAGPADRLLLVNPDLTLSGGALEALQAALDTGAAFAGPRIVDGSGRASASPAPAPNWLYVWGVLARLVLGRATFQRLVRRIRLDRLPLASARAHAGRLPQGDAHRPLGRRAYLSGSCLAVRGDAFAAVGGFDPRFFMYSEDADLCVRLSTHGYKGVYCPGATVVHAVGASGGAAVRSGAQALDGMLRYLELHQRPVVCRLWYAVTLGGLRLWSLLCGPATGARLEEARTRLASRAWHWTAPAAAEAVIGSWSAGRPGASAAAGSGPGPGTRPA